MMIVREGENGYKRVGFGQVQKGYVSPQLREVRHYALLVCAAMRHTYGIVISLHNRLRREASSDR
jgi:hypothetical protein